MDAHRMTEIAPCQRLQVNDGEGMVAAAVLGLDICQVPDKMVGEELAGGTLVELLPGHRPPAMPISIVMPSVRLQPPRVRALLNALAQLERR
jgi:LysR family transcriptional regulator, regulator for bpeEF and oprC